ncbi:MAG TPA: TonB-dependent receptor, partial [Acidobacteriaceae bacterium]
AKNSPFATPDANGNIVKNKLRNEQYGASIGGPVFKDKLFYFANYEKQQFIIESPASATEPSVAFQAQAKQVLAQYGIPVNPVQQNVLNALWPAYALTGPATSSTVTSNYSNASPITGYSYNGVAKMDYTINSKNTLSGRAYGGQGNQIAPVGTQLPYYFEEGPIHVFNYSATLNTVLTPHLTNQVLIGVNYFNQVFYDQNHTFNMEALGLNTGVDPAKLSGAPAITISGFDNLSNATPPSGRNDITGLITDTIAQSIGKHEFRYGGEFRQGQVDEFYHRHERGLFQYDGTQGPWSQTTAGSSACDALAGGGGGTVRRAAAKAGITPAFTDTATLALADYLAGCAVKDGITVGDTARQVFVNTYDLFFQDAWQISSRFNLNYGARYDYLGPLHNGAKNLSVFRPNASGTTTPGVAFQGAQIGSLFEPAHDDISPRIGFTYSPRDTAGVVVRGGFGVFFDEPNLNPFLDNRPPNGGASGAESNPAGPSPVSTLGYTDQVIPSNGALLFPTSGTFAPYGTDASGAPITSRPTPTSTPVNNYNLFSVNPNFRSAYNWNYNLNVEKSLGPNLIATLGYVGSQGRKLLIIHDINQAQVGTTGLGTFNQNATRPLEMSTGGLYGTYPFYGVINEIDSAGTSNYNSLQTTIRSTNWHGLTSQFGYTWAHGLDEMTQYRNAVPQNSLDLKSDYGNMDYDTRNNFTAYLNYALPGDGMAGPHWLTHGWQLNSLISLHSGQPYSVYTGTDTSGTGEGEDRVNQVGFFVKGNRQIANHSGSLSWFTNDPAHPTFVAPVNNFGSMRRNQLYGPGYEDVDFSVFKDGHITEKVMAQFRV